ncbi:MAG: hypothetical protein ABJF01_01800 [bacterium]
MRQSRIVIAFLIAFTVAAPALALGQRTASAPAGKVAGIAPAPAQPAPANPNAPRRPVFFGNIPVVVLPDGRVFADFGRGFERVVRSCGVPVNFGAESPPGVVQPAVVQPSIAQPPVGASQPLPYTPAVPNQPTASQQMLPQAEQQAQASRSTVVNPNMCWSNDARGKVFVGRP